MDRVDSSILASLRANGRVRAGELAGTLGISRSAAAARLAQLLQSGKVRVVGVVHPAVLGLHSVAHVSIAVDGPVLAVAARIAELDEVPFVSLVTGPAAMVAEVRVRHGSELASCLGVIRAIAGVQVISTLTYTDMVIDVLRPLATSEPTLDDVDLRLLALLQVDGRMSYTEMSARAGLSIGTVRLRVRRLLNDRVIRVGALTTPGAGEQQYAIGVGIQVAGAVAGTVDAVAEEPMTTFLATTIGRFDVLATVTCPSLPEGVAAVDRIRALPDVVAVESWLHMNIFKEHYQFSPSSGTPGSQTPAGATAGVASSEGRRCSAGRRIVRAPRFAAG